MRIQLENFEALLDEYTTAVRESARAAIDAGCCGTREDFQKMRRCEATEAELLAKVMIAASRLMTPPKQVERRVSG